MEVEVKEQTMVKLAQMISSSSVAKKEAMRWN